ncbi:hypothetical protein BX600DRAFT_504557 [Xylariales sp. PMI_506]|nr:hypothetical protein BX600DRAFT_504557 [Xylariales sp. PMI_506]
MDVPQHMQIINIPYCRGEDVMFPKFSMLPIELRQHIWRLALERHRLLDVILLFQHPSQVTNTYSSTNKLDKLISGDGYMPVVQAFQLNSKLLRVSRESRRAALSFYRVQFPCYLQDSKVRRRLGSSEGRVKGILYFNPEFDYIAPKVLGYQANAFIDFLHDLRAYDPRDIGVLNLALRHSTVRYGLEIVEAIPGPDVKASFLKSISQLQEIMWMVHSTSARGISEEEGFKDIGMRFNYSLPIRAVTPYFDLLKRDPRPVWLEVTNIVVPNVEALRSRVNWYEQLRRLEIPQAHSVKERVLFSYDSYLGDQQVYNVTSANTFLSQEQQQWLMSQYPPKDEKITEISEGVPNEAKGELAQAVRPAIGFWLFPLETLGSPTRIEEGHSASNVLDMNRLWPELAIQSIF